MPPPHTHAPSTHREIMQSSPLPRPPRWREGTWPPVSWVINSPFVCPKCSRWSQENPPTPNCSLALGCALPALCRGAGAESSSKQARVTWWPSRSCPLCCATVRLLAIVPRRGGRCPDSGSTPASSPKCPRSENGWGLPLCILCMPGRGWRLYAPRGNRRGAGGWRRGVREMTEVGATSATASSSAHPTQFPCWALVEEMGKGVFVGHHFEQ